MKKLILIVIALVHGHLCFAQLPNQNTYLLAQVNGYPGYSGLWGYTAPSHREYALLGCNTGTSIVDITDSANIHEIDFVPGVNSSWREIKTYSHYAYVVSEGEQSRLQIIDLEYLPDSVSLVETFSYAGYTRTHAISQSGPYLYLSGGNACSNGGVQVLDITNPVFPVIKGNNTVRYVHDCRILNDTVWACNILNQKISIISAQDKDNLQEVRSFVTLQTMPHNCAITNDRKYLYVTHENLDPGKLEIWDIEDLSNITYLRDWQPTGITTSIIHNVEIYGHYALLAHYTAGIRILDITNAENPLEIAWYDTRPQDNSTNYQGCWAVYLFPSGKIIGSDIVNGLFVIKTSFPITQAQNHVEKITADFEVSPNYPNPFNSSTKIKINIPFDGNIKISLFDATGKEVGIITNDYNIAGVHYFTFDTNKYFGGLASGIYFYKTEYAAIGKYFSKVSSMIILK